MGDDRYIANLERQLKDARAGEGAIHSRMLEQAHARQKAAENVAATSQRKREEAERKLRAIEADLEETRARLERAEAEAGKLAELNARIEKAKHVDDLLELA